MKQLTKLGKILIGIGIAWAVLGIVNFNPDLLNSEIYSVNPAYAAGQWFFLLLCIPFVIVGLSLKKGEPKTKGLSWSWSK